MKKKKNLLRCLNGDLKLIALLWRYTLMGGMKMAPIILGANYKATGSKIEGLIDSGFGGIHYFK